MATDSTRMSCIRYVALLLLGGVWQLTAPAPSAAQDPAAISVEEYPINLVMFHDPQLQVGTITLMLPDELKALWLKAMDRGDNELQRIALDSFKLAHDRGMKDLKDTHARLADLLKAPNQDSIVQRAAVHTLIHLDAREYAQLLAESAKSHGLTTAILVEPALARWKSDLLTDEWLSRIDDPRASLANRILAIDGLGETEELKAASLLERITVNSRVSANERMSAARALSKMQATDLVKVANAMVDPKSQPGLLNSVLALELMKALDSDVVIALLKRLVAHDSTAIQSGALQQLYTIDPKHVYEFAEVAIKSKDAGVRTVGAQALAVQKQGKLIAPLAMLLDDVNPTLRRQVAKAMLQLASEPELLQEVITQATSVLSQNGWRGIEQATIVLVLIDHKPTGDRLIELLPHPRTEVMDASAWGLRMLALPEHLPVMLARAQQLDTELRAEDPPYLAPGVDIQLAQLFLAFGQMRHMDAETLLMNYVPKNHDLGYNSRAAAVWSVGWLNEGQAPQKLTATMIARLSDTMSSAPEHDYVRRMCAVSLARMKSESAIPTLRKFIADDSGYVRRSCYWAVEQLTGEVAPPPENSPFSFSDWFLVPTL